VEESGRVARRKPVIALKVGRFAGGQRAVASHTGALAGEESAYNAAFRRAGVIRADTSEEVFDWARALAWCPAPKGRAIAILTNAGGPGVTAADALEAEHMRLAALSPETVASLGAFLPPAASLHNPVDMLASATPEQYAHSLEILLSDPEADGVLVILPPPPTSTAGAVAKALIPVIHTAGKPVVVALMGERLIQEAVEHFRAAHVPEYRFPERAASALAILAERAEFLQREREQPVRICDADTRPIRAMLRSAEANKPSGKNGILAPQATQHLLETYGIPAIPTGLARSPQEAVEVARRFGLPVALKVAAGHITHKSDVGGVALNLNSEQAVIRAFNTVVANAQRAHPEEVVSGAAIQPMIFAGQDVIIGAVQDAQFGALVMFGSGGVEVEGLKDVAFALAPVTREEAGFLLERTWAGRKLKGYRNLPPADREAVVDIILRMAQMAADCPELAEIEINPLRVLEEGQGALALDVRARLAELASEAKEH
jgi:acetyltransferase